MFIRTILKKIHSIIYFVEAFYHEFLLDLFESFLYINWYDIMIFIFYIIDVIYYVNFPKYADPSLQPCGESHLIVVYHLFWYAVRLGLLKCLLRKFTLMFIGKICLAFSFFTLISTYGSIGVMLAS